MPHSIFIRVSAVPKGPLHILFRSCLTGSGSVIVVEDNGPRFVTADESESHAALTNIRQLPELMCSDASNTVFLLLQSPAA